MPVLRADPPPNSKRPVTVRAIHASAAVHAWYFAELDALVSRMQAEVSRAVLAAYGSLEPQEMAHDEPFAYPRVMPNGNFGCVLTDMAEDAKQYPFEVLVKGGSAGERSTRAAAEQLAARVISMSRGKLTDADVKIVERQAHDAAPANPSLLLRAALRKWGGLWVSRFDKLSLDLGQKFATKSFNLTQTQMRAALKDAGFTVKFAPTPGSRAAYQAVIAEQVNLIKSIPQQYLKDVESKVWGSVMKGADMHALSVDLRKTYGITRDRAAVIARDQNNKAKAIIEKTRRQELGITHAIWQHSAAGRVPRATHVAMSGKAYPLAQGMYDSDEGKYVLPGELINCRCTSKAIIPAFDTVESAERRAKETPYLRAARNRAR